MEPVTVLRVPTRAPPPPRPPDDPRPVGPRTIPRYPGYGARPFGDGAEQQRVFFGRAAETDALFQAILASRITVVYGMSGAGKTSLLKAGVFPRLLEEAHLPVLTRVSRAPSPAALVIAAIRGACADAGLELEAGDERGLWEFLKTSVIWRGHAVLTPVLVFDQFEEFFRTAPEVRLDPAFRAAFAAELGALAAGVAPERLRRDRAPDGRRLDPSAPEARVVISLREEDFGALQELTAAVPGLFHHPVRIAPLSRAQAAQAIRGPAALDGPLPGLPGVRLASPAFEVDDGALAAILDFLQSASGEFEGWQLQQVCAQLETRVVPRLAAAHPGAAPILHEADVVAGARLATALEAFYLDAIATLPGRQQQRRARALCEEGLITRDGRRVMLETSQIATDFHVAPETVARLDALHVVRHAWRIGGLHYELTHDRLAEAVLRRRKLRVPRRYRVALPVLLAGALATTVVGTSLWTRVQQARAHAEGLAQILLTDEFLDELRASSRIAFRDDLQARLGQYLDKTRSDEPWAQRNRALTERSAGEILAARGRLAAAEEKVAASITLLEGLRRRDPTQRTWGLDLASSLEQLAAIRVARGDLPWALDLHRRALEAVGGARRTAGELRARADLLAAEAHVSIAEILICQGLGHDAVPHLDEAEAVAGRISSEARAAPDDGKKLAGLSRSAGVLRQRALVVRGELLVRADRVEEARAAYRAALDAAPGIPRGDRPAAFRYQAVARTRLATVAPDDALGARRRGALKRAESLAEWDPDDGQLRRELAFARLDVAEAQRGLDPRERAASANGLRAALDDMRALVGADGGNEHAAWRFDLARILLAAARDGEAARELRAEAETILAALTARDPSNREWALARGWNLLDLADLAADDPARALVVSREALRLAGEPTPGALADLDGLRFAIRAARYVACALRTGGDRGEAERIEAKRVEQLAAILEEHPYDPFLLNEALVAPCAPAARR